MGEIDLAGILILKLFQAAPRAAVAQAFPFGLRHLFQRLGFPKESLLSRGRLGSGGHEVLRFPGGNRFKGLLGTATPKVQVGCSAPDKSPWMAFALLFKIVARPLVYCPRSDR